MAPLIYYLPFMLVIIAAAAVAKHSIARSLCVLNEESSLNAAAFTPRLNSGRVITASCYLSVVGLYGFVRERGLRSVCALASARPVDKKVLPARAAFTWSAEVAAGHGV